VKEVGDKVECQHVWSIYKIREQNLRRVCDGCRGAIESRTHKSVERRANHFRWLLKGGNARGFSRHEVAELDSIGKSGSQLLGKGRAEPRRVGSGICN
jgi:hypothetical protein